MQKGMAQSDDLSPWLLSIETARKSHPKDKEKLLPHLTLCAGEFEKDPRFHDDIRYLRVCLELAICSPDPERVFLDLEKKEIGRKHATAYEVYATYLEGKKRFEDAKAVYKLGLSRDAQPLERLKHHYNLFIGRLSSRFKRKQTAQNLVTVSRQKLHGEASTPDVPECSIANPLKGSSHPMPLKGSLLFDDKGDQSFEEQRLAHWKQLNPVASKVPDHFNEAKSVPNILCSIGSSHSFGDVTMEIRSFAERAISRDTEVEDARHHGLVEPTINTKEALADILSMFSEPLDTGRPRARKKPNCNPAVPTFSVYEDGADEEDEALHKATGFSVYEDERFPTNMRERENANGLHRDIFKDADFKVFEDECFQRNGLDENKSLDCRGNKEKCNKENGLQMDVFVEERFQHRGLNENKSLGCRGDKENGLQMDVFVDECFQPRGLDENKSLDCRGNKEKQPWMDVFVDEIKSLGCRGDKKNGLQMDVFVEERFQHRGLDENKSLGCGGDKENRLQIDVFVDECFQRRGLNENKSLDCRGDKENRPQMDVFVDECFQRRGLIENKSLDCRGDKDVGPQMDVFADEECILNKEDHPKPAIAVLRDRNMHEIKRNRTVKKPTMDGVENAPFSALQQH